MFVSGGELAVGEEHVPAEITRTQTEAGHEGVRFDDHRIGEVDLEEVCCVVRGGNRGDQRQDQGKDVFTLGHGRNSSRPKAGLNPNTCYDRTMKTLLARKNFQTLNATRSHS